MFKRKRGKILKPIKQKVPYKMLFGLLFKIGLILFMSMLLMRPVNIIMIKKREM